MPASHLGLVVDLLGFLTGTVLYVMLVALVWRDRAGGHPLLSPTNRVSLLTGLFGCIWNIGALASFGDGFAGAGSSPRILAVSFAALGLLPALMVQALLESREPSAGGPLARVGIVAAYTLSVAAGAWQFVASFQREPVPAPGALWLLTVGFTCLTLWLLVVARRPSGGHRGIGVVALAIFAVSALHFNRHSPGEAWWIDLVGHHASIPLALAILHQDFRFAFADLFLKNAIALILLVALSFGLLSGFLLPVLAWRREVDPSDPWAVAIVIVVWIATVVSFPALRQVAARGVDRLVLGRPDYDRLLIDATRSLETLEEEGEVLRIASAATASAFRTSASVVVDDVFEARQWQVVRAGESAVWPDRPWSAAVPVRTVEAPRHVIVLAPLEQGRRLLSDDIVWLSALAQAAARRIDALRVSNERFERNRREESIQRLATEAELRALRSQLNPHFLFNALTTVGYLIQHAPAKALDTLLRLTSVLRGVLRRTTSEFSTLGEEVDLINAYLDIERTRFEERLQVEIHMRPQARECMIPTLLLQPLVENAVKHGVASKMAKGTVVVRADVHADAVRVAVEDSGPGFELADAERRPGIGLRSVRDRLRVHYGASASLRVRRDPDSGRTVVEIEFPARAPMAAPVAPRKSA